MSVSRDTLCHNLSITVGYLELEKNNSYYLILEYLKLSIISHFTNVCPFLKLWMRRRNKVHFGAEKQEGVEQRGRESLRLAKVME